MGWTAPRTYTAGEIITASILNSAVRDNLRYLKGLDGAPVIEGGLRIDESALTEYIKLPNLTTAQCQVAVTPENGRFVFDLTTQGIMVKNNSGYPYLISTDMVDDTPVNGADTVPVSSNWAYDFINTLTTAGDITYATAAGVWARLAKGTAAQHLRMNSGATAPEWATVSGLQILSSSYTRDGTNDRQIATGFACKLVIVHRSAATAYAWVCLKTANSIKLDGTPTVNLGATDVLLHATDGFVVDNANANQNTVGYAYVALG